MIFSEVKIHQPDSFEDYRGELYTIYKKGQYDLDFNHDKVSISKCGVLRGLHTDNKSWKLITCLAGEIYLVIVDVHPTSPNYLKWDSIILSEKNKKQILIPPMFANGHLVLSPTATFFYKWAYPGSYPDVNDQLSFRWDDPKLNINWPINTPILSSRDKNSKLL